MRCFIYFGIAALLLLGLAGCRVMRCSEGATPLPAPPGPPPNRHLIYSPDTEETLVRNDYESTWPSAVEAFQPVELIDYREIIFDRQGRNNAREDQYYRHFESTRTGRSIR